MGHRELWKTVFQDTDQYIDFYFKEKAVRSDIYSKYEGGELVSMAFFTPCEMIYRGNECICPYIVGVATHPAYRHRGYMRELLTQGMSDAKRRGCELVFLCPADEKIYEPFGFRGVQYRDQLTVSGCGHAWYAVRLFSEQSSEEKKRAAEFAAARLSMSGFDLYRKRNTAYYQLLDEEMKALDGSVIVVQEDTGIRGVAAYLYEDGTYEVTEVICAPSDGQKIVQSICAYLARSDREKILFSDGQFLDSVTGAGIVRKKEEKAYIMLRDLEEKPDAEEIRVYINDIT